MSVRDKVTGSGSSSGSSSGGSGSGSGSSDDAKTKSYKKQEDILNYQNKYRFHSTFDIIKAAEEGNLPDKIMITVHPQRWTGKSISWLKELVWQNVKNVGKKLLVEYKRN